MKCAVNVPTVTTLFSGQILSEKHFSIYLFVYLFIYLTTVATSATIVSNGGEVIERSIVKSVEEAAGDYCEVLYQNLLGGTEEDHEICYCCRSQGWCLNQWLQTIVSATHWTTTFREKISLNVV
jgi:hypothetical protein